MSDPEMIVEPTNDLDTDMLAAMEDLLDTWPGTLIVVSHDRYFIERVTDQQYAILNGHLRHLPGGVDEYLRLRAAAGQHSAEAASGASDSEVTSSTSTRLSGAELRAAQKEAAAIERRLAKLTEKSNRARAALAEHDQSDYEGLNAKMERIREFEAEAGELEERWFALTEEIG